MYPAMARGFGGGRGPVDPNPARRSSLNKSLDNLLAKILNRDNPPANDNKGLRFNSKDEPID